MYIENLSERYPDLTETIPPIMQAFELLKSTFREGGMLLVCGNGGSAADSEHIVGELMKGFLSRRPAPEKFRRTMAELYPADGEMLAAQLQQALPAISLVSQTSLLSACANDISAEMIFAQQVYGYGQPGDVILGITTSGNSLNVLHALQVGRACGLRTLGLTGRGSPAMQQYCDVLICVQADSTPEIQEYHQVIYHALCADLEREFFPV
jgi:D-sedoheptulose 7-phosphate isomerase